MVEESVSWHRLRNDPQGDWSQLSCKQLCSDLRWWIPVLNKILLKDLYTDRFDTDLNKEFTCFLYCLIFILILYVLRRFVPWKHETIQKRTSNLNSLTLRIWGWLSHASVPRSSKNRKACINIFVLISTYYISHDYQTNLADSLM